MLSKKDFEKYYLELNNAIYNYVYYKTWNNEEVAYDLTSEIFLKALKNLKSYQKEKSSFKTRIYTIAFHSIIDFYRTQRNDISLENQENFLSYYDEILEKIDQEQILKKVYTEMNSLPYKTKTILRLRIFENLSFQEIAEITQSTPAACKMQLKRWIIQLWNSFSILIFLLFL